MSEGPSSRELKNVALTALYIIAAIALAIVIYRVVILPAPPITGSLPQPDNRNILDQLGPQTAVWIVIVMIGLVAWVFWLFIQYGRRVSERGYLGNLTSDALARAEAQREDDLLKADLRAGLYAVDIDVTDPNFLKKYRIPSDWHAPRLVAGVDITQDALNTIYRPDFLGGG